MSKYLVPLLMSASICDASNHLGDSFKDFDISGYLGYKYIWSSADVAPYRSYPEVGLLVNYNINTKLDIFTQFSINENIEKSFEHGIVYSYISYTDSVYEIPFQISIGKIRHATGLHTSTEVNPATRLGVVSPQGMAWSSLDIPRQSGYGGNIDIYLDDFVFGYSVSKYIVGDESLESVAWSGTEFLKLKPKFGRYQVFSINYNPIDIPIRIVSSLSKVKFNDSIQQVELLNFGISYDDNRYLAEFELLYSVPDVITWKDFEYFGKAYSATLGYYFSDCTFGFINYNTYSGTGLPKFFLNLPPQVDIWDEFIIGVTKEFYDIEVKADIHHVRGARTLDPNHWKSPGLDSWWYTGVSIVYHF